MASTVHLEFRLVSGATLTIDLTPAKDRSPAVDEMALVTRLMEMVERSTTRTRGDDGGASAPV